MKTNRTPRLFILLGLLFLTISCGKEEPKTETLPPSNTTNPPRTTPTPTPTPNPTPVPSPVSPAPVPVPIPAPAPAPAPVAVPAPVPAPVPNPVPTLAPVPFVVGTAAHTSYNWVSMRNELPEKTITKLLFFHKGSSPIEITGMKIFFASSHLKFTDTVVVVPNEEKEVWLGVEDKLNRLQFYVSGETEKLEVRAH